MKAVICFIVLAIAGGYGLAQATKQSPPAKPKKETAQREKVVKTDAEWKQMLREVWRVLSESGKLIVVVPNRRGIWSRLESTPFGSGQPYTAGQLARLLHETMFVPSQTRGALFLPPTTPALFRRIAPSLEGIGRRLFPAFSGVVVVEAEKQIYALTSRPACRRKTLLVSVTPPIRTTARGSN